QVPEGLEVVLHLPAAADHEALLRLLDAIERAARELELFQDGDLVPGHVAVADEEGRTGQRGQTCADEPRRLVLHALRLPRPGERIVVAAVVFHRSFLSWYAARSVRRVGVEALAGNDAELALVDVVRLQPGSEPLFVLVAVGEDVVRRRQADDVVDLERAHGSSGAALPK